MEYGPRLWLDYGPRGEKEGAAGRHPYPLIPAQAGIQANKSVARMERQRNAGIATKASPGFRFAPSGLRRASKLIGGVPVIEPLALRRGDDGADEEEGGGHMNVSSPNHNAGKVSR